MSMKNGLLSIASACGQPLGELDIASSPTQLEVEKLGAYRFWSGSVIGNFCIASGLALVIIAAVYQYQSLCNKKGDRQLSVAFQLSSTFWLILSQPVMVGFIATASYAENTENRWYRLVVSIGVVTILTIVVWPLWILYRVHKEQPLIDFKEPELPPDASRLKRIVAYLWGSYKSKEWGEPTTDLRVRWGFFFEHTSLLSYAVVETLAGFAINVTIGTMQDPKATNEQCKIRAVIAFLAHLPPLAMFCLKRCMLSRFDMVINPTTWTMNALTSLFIMLKFFGSDMDTAIEVIGALMGALSLVASCALCLGLSNSIMRALGRKQVQSQQEKEEREAFRRLLIDTDYVLELQEVVGNDGGGASAPVQVAVPPAAVPSGSNNDDDIVREMLGSNAHTPRAEPASAAARLPPPSAEAADADIVIDEEERDAVMAAEVARLLAEEPTQI